MILHVVKYTFPGAFCISGKRRREHKMKIINARCPLQDECGRKKCAYQFRELDCPYYWANARPDSEIPDQEAIRYEKHT